MSQNNEFVQSQNLGTERRETMKMNLYRITILLNEKKEVYHVVDDNAEQAYQKIKDYICTDRYYDYNIRLHLIEVVDTEVDGEGRLII